MALVLSSLPVRMVSVITRACMAVTAAAAKPRKSFGQRLQTNMAKERTPEDIVLDAACEYLAYKKYFFFRINNAPVYDANLDRKTNGRTKFRKPPKYSVKGVSDLMVVHKSRCYFIEIKAPKGVQSEDQKKFEKNVTDQNVAYLLVRSVQDLVDAGF